MAAHRHRLRIFAPTPEKSPRFIGFFAERLCWQPWKLSKFA